MLRTTVACLIHGVSGAISKLFRTGRGQHRGKRREEEEEEAEEEDEEEEEEEGLGVAVCTGSILSLFLTLAAGTVLTFSLSDGKAIFICFNGCPHITPLLLV